MRAKPNATTVEGLQDLSIRQAAAMLNVSCPFVLRLICAGDIKGVSTLLSGQRRVRLAEIARVKAEMSEATRNALHSLYYLTEPIRCQQGVTNPRRAEAERVIDGWSTPCHPFVRHTWPMPARKSPKDVASIPPRFATSYGDGITSESMFFGRGFEKFASAGIGVPRPLKGEKAIKVALRAGIITPSGKLAKRYR